MEKYTNNLLNIRRENKEAGKPFVFGDLVLDKLRKDNKSERATQFRNLNIRVTNSNNGKSERLRQQEYEVLHLLMSSASTNTPLSMQEINEWMYRDIPDDKDIPISNVTSIILVNLRRILARIESKVKIHRVKSGKSATSMKEVLLTFE